MSTPRLCDSCGDVFSELEEGWTTSTQTQISDDDHGNQRTISVRVDACPECSPKTSDTIKKLRAHRRAMKTRMLELETAPGQVGDDLETALREVEHEQ